jgi:hypothetical protein
MVAHELAKIAPSLYSFICFQEILLSFVLEVWQRDVFECPPILV